MHQPVLLEEILSFFKACHLKTFVDGTVGFGGHAEAILRAHPEIETFYAVDRDESALELTQERLKEFPAVELVHANFADLEIEGIDGMLLDLGVSSMQLDQKERGFSFSKEGPLDMRMDQSQRLNAKTVVNRYTEKELGRIFRDYGEERKWRAVAAEIVRARKRKKIETTTELVEVLKPVLGWQRKHFNPMTLVFQALRIEVNQELSKLEGALDLAISHLSPKGRLAVISFHSLEDRIVKHNFRKNEVVVLTKKPIIARDEEIKRNARSRSAKLRVVEKE
ncbi:MAG: Ribosomal RNA small subunit methyltransferase H [Chlamydiales bacterium]|nr:Ribosomal RNA small subunit methyltransferase H [Chlamydiales bacterium]MCH9620013.1 Ribosomal RNA small subunit methyltransferase H [Chlamydiales bacterium]MCH9622883.1 Ribosomal RNA small subunit methyltransferase H [Chlamydiales bacterium]